MSTKSTGLCPEFKPLIILFYDASCYLHNPGLLIKKKKSNFTNMKKTKQLSKGLHIIKVDKKLDEYLAKNLFKEKVDKANRILKATGLPKFEN